MRKGKREISLEKLMAYVGLELAMSKVQIGSIHQYWEASRFSGHPDFRATMSRYIITNENRIDRYNRKVECG